MISLLAVVVLGYLIGSFPSGIVIGKLFRGVDVREHGSRNMGATNVYRVLGGKLAVIVLLLDIAKGVIATVLITRINFGDLVLAVYWLKIIGGFSAILGHIFPAWVGFKGGKGVGTAAGVFLALMPMETGLALVFFVIVVGLTKYVSLGSISASVFLAASLFAEKLYLGAPVPIAYLSLSLLLMITVIITHRQNIKRLIRGEENRFGKKVSDVSR